MQPMPARLQARPRSSAASTRRGRACETRFPPGPTSRALALPRNHADVAVRLQDGEAHVFDRFDLLKARALCELFERQPLAAKVTLDRLPVLDEDDGLALHHA